MKLMKIFSVILLAGTLLVSVPGCSGTDYKPIELAPEGAEMVGGMKVSEALRDWQIYCNLTGNEDKAEWFDEKKAEFYEKTGIDMNDISEVVLFAKYGDSESSEMEYAGIIMSGSFTDKNIIDTIEEKTGKELTPETYGAYTLHVNPEGESAIVHVNNTILLMGTPEALKGCLDVADGKLQSLSGDILASYNGMGDAMLRLVMTVPEGAMDSLSGQPEIAMMPVGFQSFAEMKTMGMAIDMDMSAVTVKTSFGFSDAASATDAVESIENLINFFAMMSTDEASAETMDRIEITTSADTVNMNFEITLDELAEALKQMENMEDFPMIPDMDLPEGMFDSGDFDFSPDSGIPDLELPGKSGMPNPEIPELRVMPTPNISANSNMPEAEVPEGIEFR